MARNAAGLRGRARADPGAARGVLGRRAGPGRRRELNQALEKAGRVADFLELARADVPRRAGARGVVRRPLPRGAPDAGRRGAARRRALRATSRPGSGAGDGPRAGRCTRSRCAFEHVKPSPEELQVMRPQAPRLAPERPRRAGPDGATTRLPDISEHMSFLEMLDVVNEQLIAARRGADRLRPRLPRGDLRRLRLHDQRRGARPAAGAPPSASSTCATSGRRRAHARALAGARLPGGPRPDGRPRRLRPHHPGRRLRLGQHRQRAGGERHPGAEDRSPTVAMDAAQCIGCGACVAQCPNGAAQLFTARQGLAPGAPAAGPARALASGCETMVARMEAEGFGSCTQLRRVRGGLPEGDLDRLHRPDEPRLAPLPPARQA